MICLLLIIIFNMLRKLKSFVVGSSNTTANATSNAASNATSNATASVPKPIQATPIHVASNNMFGSSATVVPVSAQNNNSSLNNMFEPVQKLAQNSNSNSNLNNSSSDNMFLSSSKIAVQNPVQNKVATFNYDETDDTDPLASMLSILSEYNIVLLIDDSTSMTWKGYGKGTRWTEAIEALNMLVPIATKYDDDGIDLYFLNHTGEYQVNNVAEFTKKLANISANGGTPMGPKLKYIFNKFLKSMDDGVKSGEKVKRMNLIVITDGTPDNQQEVIDSIVWICAQFAQRAINPKDVMGIQFFQVGDDKAASAHLKYLDDVLHEEYHVPDIVDCTPFNPEEKVELKYTIYKTLLGGIDGDIDNNIFMKEYLEGK
jgi:hypothetical protein